MNRAYQSFTDGIGRAFAPFALNLPIATRRPSVHKPSLPSALFVCLLIGATTITSAVADGLTRGTGAHQARTVRELALAAARGNAQAQARLGFMYENGFGVPQNYVVAADLYQSAATHGDAFGQSRLGLSYDKGHGVPHSVIFSYAWLNLAAASASGGQADYYRRLRNAVASKMTSDQIFEAQRLALLWASGG
jgi:TPR repeat protein